jgi:hypothetical protein
MSIAAMIYITKINPDDVISAWKKTHIANVLVR